MASPTSGFVGSKGRKSAPGTADGSLAPDIAVEQISLAREGPESRWVVGWRIHNNGSRQLTLLAIHAPHGKFRSEAQEFSPAISLAPGGAARVECRVRSHEPPGTRIDNAFLILRVLWRGKAWRVFVRLQVNVKEGGQPETVVESVTTQEVGFSAGA